MDNLNPQQAYEFGLLPLVIWREAQNQPYEAMVAVGWAVKNRAAHPGWWGFDFPSIILKKYQFSSFNWNDPNNQKFPRGSEPSWQSALNAAVDVWTGARADPIGGATMYFDHSIKPPPWAVPAKHTVDVGAFSFYLA